MVALERSGSLSLQPAVVKLNDDQSGRGSVLDEAPKAQQPLISPPHWQGQEAAQLGASPPVPASTANPASRTSAAPSSSKATPSGSGDTAMRKPRRHGSKTPTSHPGGEELIQAPIQQRQRQPKAAGDDSHTQPRRPKTKQQPKPQSSAGRVGGSSKLLMGPGPASWAHMLAHPEPGCLLLSQGCPDMPWFDRNVILITSQGEAAPPCPISNGLASANTSTASQQAY